MLSANHWFIAREHSAELRISIWSGQVRLGASARHLCGHKCLHKFLDDFFARKAQVASSDVADRKDSPHRIDTRLTSPVAISPLRLPVIGSCAVQSESSARLLPAAQPFLERTQPHRLRADAWKRELERERRQLVRSS